MNQNDIDDLIRREADAIGISRDLAMAIATRESKRNPLEIGDNGQALGIFQIHPDAASEIGLDWNALNDAIAAGDTPTAAGIGVRGIEYFAKMVKLFGGDIHLALMAYNQGPGVISRANTYANSVLALSKPTT